MQFVNNSQALATLGGDGLGQNLITLEPCAIKQPHAHPRGTEVSFITKASTIKWHMKKGMLIGCFPSHIPLLYDAELYPKCSALPAMQCGCMCWVVVLNATNASLLQIYAHV